MAIRKITHGALRAYVEQKSVPVIKDWLATIIIEASDRLNDKENAFIHDMTDKNFYTQGQMDWIEQIYVKYTR